MSVWRSFESVRLFLYLPVQNVPHELYEFGGSGWLQAETVFMITLPVIKRYIFVCIDYAVYWFFTGI